MKKKKSTRPICPDTDQISELTPKQQEALLEFIMIKLDDLSCDDFFGTEGWKSYFGLED